MDSIRPTLANGSCLQQDTPCDHAGGGMRCINSGLKLAQRRRRWPDIKTNTGSPYPVCWRSSASGIHQHNRKCLAQPIVVISNQSPVSCQFNKCSAIIHSHFVLRTREGDRRYNGGWSLFFLFEYKFSHDAHLLNYSYRLGFLLIIIKVYFHDNSSYWRWLLLMYVSTLNRQVRGTQTPHPFVHMAHGWLYCIIHVATFTIFDAELQFLLGKQWATIIIILSWTVNMCDCLLCNYKMLSLFAYDTLDILL